MLRNDISFSELKELCELYKDTDKEIEISFTDESICVSITNPIRASYPYIPVTTTPAITPTTYPYGNEATWAWGGTTNVMNNQEANKDVGGFSSGISDN